MVATGLTSGESGDQPGRERVGHVVPPDDPQLIGRQPGLVPPGEDEAKGSILTQIRSPLDRTGRRGQVAGSRGPSRQLHHVRIVRVQDPAAPGARVAEEALLVREVGGDVAVPVEVVGREVEEQADVGRKSVRIGELEGAQLDDDPIGLLLPHRDLGERSADVAARQGAQSAGLEDLLAERGRRGLAVGTGDPDDPRGEVSVGELDLRDARRARVAELSPDFGRRGDAGTHHHEIGGAYPAEIVPADLGLDSLRAQFRCRRFLKLPGRDVAGVHLGPVALRQPRGGDARGSESEHGHHVSRADERLLGLRRAGIEGLERNQDRTRHAHRIFKVARLTSEQRMARM
jgi:hypothetical protein